MNKTLEHNLLKCTSIIHTEDEYGSQEQATCFFIKRTVGNTEHHYLVTNTHVLKGMTKLHIYLDQYHEDTKSFTYYKKISLSPNHAVKSHPDCDLSLLNIDSIKNLNTEKDYYVYHPIDLSMIPKDFQDFTFTDPLFMFGYPSGIHDATTNYPVVRRGIAATPVSSLYKGKREFLIDIPFLNGSSGSPIFLIKEDTASLIGIEYSKLLEKVTMDKCRNRLYRSRKYTKELETGLGLAIRADQILDLF